MRVKPSSYFLIFLTVVGLYGIIESLTYPDIKATALPLAMSSVIFILAAIEFGREFRDQAMTGKAMEAKPQDNADIKALWRRFSSALGWIVSFFLGIYVLGFWVAIPLFMVSYLRLQRESWLLAIGLTVLMEAFVYGTFEFALQGQLYKGLIFGGRW